MAKLPTLDELVLNVSSVPSLPVLYSRLDETINHPRSSIADIAKVLSEDQGLAFRVLKLANSPLFGYFSRIDTVTQAVTIIGIQQVRDLALAISVMGLFKGIPEDLITMESFWRHSIVAALSARVLAASQRETNLERFFVAGVLHDIGRLVLFTCLPALCRDIMEVSRQEQRPLFEIERQFLGYDHADIGGTLLRRWKLPVRVSEPVENHHRCRDTGQFPRESAVLHCADFLTHALELGGCGEGAVPPLVAGSWERLSLAPYQIPQIVSQIDAQFAQISLAMQGTTP